MNLWIKKFVMFTLLFTAQAMPIKTRMLKPGAYFQESDSHLFEALDLKSKTLTFGKNEFEACGTSLVRKAQTLTYSCTLPIASRAAISKLQNLVTAAKTTLTFGGTQREVLTSVSSDAKNLTLTTAFDATAIDFDISKFNDDLFGVYAKVAQLVISEALSKQPVRIEVLESR